MYLIFKFSILQRINNGIFKWRFGTQFFHLRQLQHFVNLIHIQV